MNAIKLISAMVTPFDDDDQIDFAVLQILLSQTMDYHDGYLLGGSTGEGDSLSTEELQALINFYRNYDFIKIVNIPTDCTHKTIELIRSLLIPAGFVVLLRVPAYYLPSQEGMVEHFVAILNKFPELRFIIYDIPKRTGSILNVDSIRRIKERTENLDAIKDCTDDLKRVALLSTFIDVFCGNDEKAVEYLEAGACGLISVFSIVERNYFLSVIKKEIAIKPMTLSLKMGNPTCIKYILEKSGYRSMNLRLPLKKIGF